MDIRDAGPRWTVEAINRLKELATAGVPADLISQAMHQPLSEIVSKSAELGLPLNTGRGSSA